MVTTIKYDKQQISEMMRNKNPAITLMKPKNAKSIKWNGYLQILVNGHAQHFISCLKCHTVLVWKADDGTNVMDKHDKACRQQLSPSQISIESFYRKNNNVSTRFIISTKRKLTTCLAECCALDSLPFTFANGDGFKELAGTLLATDSQSSSSISIEDIIPDPTTISREIDRIYDLRKEQLISFLSTVDHFVVTVEFWTCEKTKVHYGGLALHCYSECYRLLVFILACQPYDLSTQSADNIRLFTDNIFELYGLPSDRVKYVVSDNENMMRASFRNSISHIGCSCHVVNKMIEHSLCNQNIDCDDIQRLFNDIHELMVFLRTCHNQSKLSKKLQLFAKTRWCSVYDMIISFIDVYPDLNGVLSDESCKSVLVGIDFNQALAFAKYLKFFVDVNELLSAEQTPTIQLVLPFKQRLMKLSQPNSEDSSAMIKYKKYFENEIPTYWKLDDIHYMAAILHPKMKHLHICSDKEKDKAYTILQNEINKRYIPQTNVSSSSATLAVRVSNTPSTTNNFLAQCFDQPLESSTKLYVNDELKRYLKSIDSLANDNENLLVFWQRQKNSFPTLYSIAREILIIPASNTSVERLFSASGNTITGTRTRLSAEKVNKLMFIKKNLPILKKIFVKTGKLHHIDVDGNTSEIIAKGGKRFLDDIDDDDNDDMLIM